MDRALSYISMYHEVAELQKTSLKLIIALHYNNLT